MNDGLKILAGVAALLFVAKKKGGGNMSRGHNNPFKHYDKAKVKDTMVWNTLRDHEHRLAKGGLNDGVADIPQSMGHRAFLAHERNPYNPFDSSKNNEREMWDSLRNHEARLAKGGLNK